MKGAMRRLVVLLALAGPGCEAETPLTDAGADSSGPAKCGAGLVPYKTACLPRLDDCAGDQVPVPGGGCQRIGVEPCTPAGGGAGIKGPPDWTCKTIGQPSCASGWTRVAGGWCEPILPSVKCGKGYMEVIGKTTCQEVGDCGTGSWGKIKIDKETIFVDGSYAGASPDGTQANPYPTIAAALAAAPEHGYVAIAAGTYVESLAIDRAVTLEGRCPRLVTIKAAKESLYVDLDAAIRVRSREVTLRGLRVTGPAGVVVDGGEAVLEELVLEGVGLSVWDGAKATMRDSLVAGAQYGGVSAAGSSLTLERSVVRDTRASPFVTEPHGTGVLAVHLSGRPATLVIRDSVIAGNLGTSVVVASATATIERTTVRAGKPYLPDGLYGDGVVAFTVEGKSPASIVMRDSEVAGNRTRGLGVFGASAILERSAVRDTLAQPIDKALGTGIGAGVYAKRAPTLIVRDSWITRNRFVGIFGNGASVVVERTVVERTREQEADLKWGVGLQMQSGASLVLRDSRVSGNRNAGVSCAGASAAIERSVIEDTLGEGAGNGPGIVVTDVLAGAASLSVKDSLVRRNASSGIGVQGVPGTIERTVVRDTRPVLGRAVGIAGWSQPGIPMTLTVRDCLVTGNRVAGVALDGTNSVIERSAIVDTLPNEKSQGGLGLVSVGGSKAASMVLRDSLVARNRIAGVLLSSISATLERVLVARTLAEPGGGYGDGINVSKFGTTPTRLVLRDSLIEASPRANLLFDGGGGTVERSVVRRGRFSVALEQGAAPSIDPSTVLEGNTENRVTYGQGLTAAPAPKLPPAPGQ